MGAATPGIKTQIQRNRETEMIHRGIQYSRAIKRFYAKFGRYPTSLEQLENTDNIRFLRKEYRDPMAAGGQWRLLHVGDVAMNLQSVGIPAPAMTSAPGNAGPVDGQPAFRESPGTQAGSSGTFAGTAAGSGAAATSSRATSGISGGASATTNNGMKTIDAGAVIGVVSTSEEQGMHAFNDKSRYSQWYFIYDPTLDNGALITRPYTGTSFKSAGFATQTPQKITPLVPNQSTDSSPPEQSEVPKQ